MRSPIILFRKFLPTEVVSLTPMATYGKLACFLSGVSCPPNKPMQLMPLHSRFPNGGRCLLFLLAVLGPLIYPYPKMDVSLDHRKIVMCLYKLGRYYSFSRICLSNPKSVKRSFLRWKVLTSHAFGVVFRFAVVAQDVCSSFFSLSENSFWLNF